jgi:hypothetical protein
MARVKSSLNGHSNKIDVNESVRFDRQKSLLWRLLPVCVQRQPPIEERGTEAKEEK